MALVFLLAACLFIHPTLLSARPRPGLANIEAITALAPGSLVAKFSDEGGEYSTLSRDEAAHHANVVQGSSLPRWMQCMFGCSEPQPQDVVPTQMPAYLPVASSLGNASVSLAPQVAGAPPAVPSGEVAGATVAPAIGTYAPAGPYAQYTTSSPSTILDDLDDPDLLWEICYAWLGALFLALLVGVCFYRRGLIGKGPTDPRRTLEYDHFGCFSDVDTCICGFCCPWLRWADTMNMARIVSFWPAVILIAGAYFLNVALLPTLPHLLGDASLGLGPYVLQVALVPVTLLLLWGRQRLRERLGLEHSNLSTCCADFWFACLCPFCLIAQEGRVMKAAYRVGHPAIVRFPYPGPTTRGYGTSPGYASQSYEYAPQDHLSQGYAANGISQQGYAEPPGYAPQGYPHSSYQTPMGHDPPRYTMTP